MQTPSSGRGPRALPQVLAWAAAQALFVGAWTAAGELTTAKRRLVRAGTVAVAYALLPVARETAARSRPPASPAVLAAPSAAGETTPATPGSQAGAGEPAPRTPATSAPGFADAAKPVAIAASGILLMAGRHRLQRHWLARLARAGHAHPHVALARRMSAAAFAISLADHAIKTYAARHPSGGGDQVNVAGRAPTG